MSSYLRQDPVREFLASVAEARTDAKRLGLKLQRLEAQATRVTSQITGMPGRGTSDRDRLLAKLADMRVETEVAKLRAEEVEREVSAFIDQIPNSASRIILKLRYCECLEWERTRRGLRCIRKEMAKVGLVYTERQLYRLHGKALQEARELYKEIGYDERRNP